MQHKKVQHEAMREKVQHEKSATHKKVQHEQGKARKKCNLKRLQYEKVQHGKVKHEMSATVKKCDMKQVQHEATRENVQHEKSVIVKYAKDVHKNTALECTNG